MIGLLMIVSIILSIVKSEYPPFYAIKMKQDNEKFTIFEQDNCDPKLYQSRENASTYLYPFGEDNSEWFISTNLVETMIIRNCKIINHGNKLYTFEDRNGTLIQKSGSKAQMIKLEDCKTYPRLTFSPVVTELIIEAKNEDEVLKNFGPNGELNRNNENNDTFFMIYSNENKTYKFYNSRNVIQLTQNYYDVSKFMVFKTDCLNRLDVRNNFEEENQRRFFFPDDSEYEYNYHDEDFKDNDDGERLMPLVPWTPKIETDIHLTIGISLATILTFLVVITVTCVMKRKKFCCFQDKVKNKVDNDLKVHKNDLYGNLSNLDEWKERYDTKIVDTNTYYDSNYTGYQDEYNEDDKDTAENIDKESRTEYEVQDQKR